jgi:hypothetical protein
VAIVEASIIIHEKVVTETIEVLTDQRCLTLYALNVAQTAKSLLNQMAEKRSFAANVLMKWVEARLETREDHVTLEVLVEETLEDPETLVTGQCLTLFVR